MRWRADAALLVRKDGEAVKCFMELFSDWAKSNTAVGRVLFFTKISERAEGEQPRGLVAGGWKVIAKRRGLVEVFWGEGYGVGWAGGCWQCLGKTADPLLGRLSCPEDSLHDAACRVRGITNRER